MTNRMFLLCLVPLALVASLEAKAAASARVMLQVGSFSAEEDAKAAADRLGQAHAATLGGVEREIHRVDLGAQGVWYRVLVGPFADGAQANDTCGRLKAAGAQCFVAPARSQVAQEQPQPAAPEPSNAKLDLPPWIVAAAPEAPSSSVANQVKADAPAPQPVIAETAFDRLLREAEQGDAMAQFQVAGLYRAGRGVARDEAQSLRWYRAAAENGLAEAEFELGKAYDTGTGGPRDPFEAVRWYRRAAQQGFGRAQYNLGSMHGNGEGVPVDYVRAYMWFSISEATLSGTEREAARNAKVRAAQLMMPDDLGRALQMAQRCLTSAYQNCD